MATKTRTPKPKQKPKAKKQRSQGNGKRNAVTRGSKALCGGTKRDGKPCRIEAGYGTDHYGSGRCKWHGGSAQATKVAAAREEAETFATAIEVDPDTAIMGVLHLAAGQLAYATSKVASLDEDDLFEGEALNRWVRVQRDVMSRIAGYAKTAKDMGLHERQVQLAEQQALMMKGLIETIVEKLNLTADQRRLIGPAIRDSMAQVVNGNGTETKKQTDKQA